jgi:hypothetical protein
MFWPNGTGGYDDTSSTVRRCRAITGHDVSHAVFAASIATSPALVVQLEPLPSLRAWRVARRLLRSLAAIALVAALVRPTRRTAKVAGLVACGLLVGWGMGKLGPYRYFIQFGGGDGLIHNGYGRAILQHAASGRWLAALQGEESVFHFMPGLRYFHALGFTVFGETNFFDLIVVLTLPVAWFWLVSGVFGRRWPAWLATAAFVALLLPDYLEIGCVYPDPLGSLLFIGGLAGLIGLGASDRNTPLSRVGLSGMSLALAFLVRPNVGIAVGLVVAWVAWRLVRVRSWAAIVLLVLTASPVSLLGAHNWFPGGVHSRESHGAASRVPGRTPEPRGARSSVRASLVRPDGAFRRVTGLADSTAASRRTWCRVPPSVRGARDQAPRTDPVGAGAAVSPPGGLASVRSAHRIDWTCRATAVLPERRSFRTSAMGLRRAGGRRRRIETDLVVVTHALTPLPCGGKCVQESSSREYPEKTTTPSACLRARCAGECGSSGHSPFRSGVRRACDPGTVLQQDGCMITVSG